MFHSVPAVCKCLPCSPGDPPGFSRRRHCVPPVGAALKDGRRSPGTSPLLQTATDIGSPAFHRRHPGGSPVSRAFRAPPQPVQLQFRGINGRIQIRIMGASKRPQLDSFLPSYLCKKKMGILNAFRNRGNRQVSFEETLVNTYKAAAENVCPEDGDVINCKEYLKKCHELPYYGCAFFQGEVDKPAQGFLNRNGRKTVSVAINMEGVSVIDRKEK
ncbi:unnamed protein product, partial [Ranitomeya imitator]